MDKFRNKISRLSLKKLELLREKLHKEFETSDDPLCKIRAQKVLLINLRIEELKFKKWNDLRYYYERRNKIKISYS